ncbi:MAG: glycoside hydrolase family 13 protein [Bacteroidota bacterium]
MSLKYILSISLCIFISGLSGQDIERVEPPFWWSGMKNDNVQLMVHGEGVSKYDIKLRKGPAKLLQVHKAESPNYVFIDLKLEQTSEEEKILFDFYLNGKKKKPLSYTINQKIEASSNKIGFNSSDVIYLLTPDRFRNGDPSNDAVEGMRELPNRSNPGGRHGGDLEGIRQSLDYISDMGFTAIWLNPVLENDMEVYSYHGYSTTDYYKVDPRFGSNEEYRNLVSEAKSKGIKVIMDHIVNHCGSFHWWMDDLPYKDWINSDNTYVQTTHRRESIQDPYASEFDQKAHSDGWFDKTMPDLNQRNPKLARYLIQNTIWWIEYLGLSGIRQDTYPYPDKEFISKWCYEIMNEYPNFNIVGEEWSYNPAIVAYWQKGKKNHDGYTSHLPSVMDFPMQKALIDAMQEETGEWSEKFADLYRALANDFQYPDPKNLVVFADNHDMSRIYKQVNQDLSSWQMIMSYLAVSRGIPQIYYGTEILMEDPDGDHGKIREDYPGGWEGDRTNAFLEDDTETGLGDSQIFARNYLKRILNWRKDKDVIHHGKTKHFAPLFAGRTYALFRYNDEEIVMLLMNKSTDDAELDISKYREVIGNALSAYDIVNEEEISLVKDRIKIRGKSAMILELSR